jgi:hypothetical protein
MAFAQLNSEDQRFLVAVECGVAMSGPGVGGGHTVQGLSRGSAVTDVLEDAQGGTVVPQRLVLVSGKPLDLSDVVKRNGLALTVADLREPNLRPLVAGQRLLVTAGILLQPADVVKHIGLTVTVADLAVGRQSRLGPAKRVGMLTEARGWHYATAERVGFPVPVSKTAPENQRLIMAG